MDDAERPLSERSLKMALVKYGGGIIQMAGSIAGNTYARNRYGNYVRARTKPINPNTSLQTAVRNAMGEMTTRWSTVLTGAQRTAWNLYGSSVAMKNRLGETTYLSGFNHYLRSNANAVRLQMAPVDAGPTLFELPAKDATIAATISEITQNITCTFDNTMDWAIETGGLMILFQGSPQNAQRNFFAGPWRLWTGIEGIDPGGAVTPKIAPATFAVAEGQRVWLYARIMRADGRISEPFTFDCVVAA